MERVTGKLLIRTGVALAAAATMAFTDVRPVFPSQNNTEVVRTTPVFEPYVDIDPKDIQTFRGLMEDLLSPQTNPQIFNDHLTSPRFKVQSTPEGKGYIYRSKPEAGTTPDIIWAIVNNSSGLVQFEVSFNPDGKIAKADPRVQYNPESLIAGVNKALKNAPENWQTTNHGDYYTHGGNTERDGVTTNYLLFGDGFLVITRLVPLNH